MIQRTLAGLAAAVAAALLAAHAPAQSSDKALSGKEVYQRVLKSAVWVRPVTATPTRYSSSSAGSGSIIDVKQNLILTNFHVIEDKMAPGKVNEDVVVFFPALDAKGKLISEREHYMGLFRAGGGARGKVIAHNMKTDLAVVRLAALPAGAQALRLGKETVSV